jgi:LPXTG-site transpeptidase (sortase) family protein
MTHADRIRLLTFTGSGLILAGLILVGLATLRPETFPPPLAPTPAYAGTPLAPPPAEVDQAGPPLILPVMPVAAAADVPPTPAPRAPDVIPDLTPVGDSLPTGWAIPDQIVIPAIDLNAPVEPVDWHAITLDGQSFGQWDVPEGFVAGWQRASARPGGSGNVVLNGHHNTEGRVFARLIDLRPRDVVLVKAGGRYYRYTVSQIMVLPEEGQPPEVRLANAAWVLPGGEPRLTLVTCWPPEGNSHRLIVIAAPEAMPTAQPGEE